MYGLIYIKMKLIPYNNPTTISLSVWLLTFSVNKNGQNNILSLWNVIFCVTIIIGIEAFHMPAVMRVLHFPSKFLRSMTLLVKKKVFFRINWLKIKEINIYKAEIKKKKIIYKYIYIYWISTIFMWLVIILTNKNSYYLRIW